VGGRPAPQQTLTKYSNIHEGQNTATYMRDKIQQHTGGTKYSNIQEGQNQIRVISASREKITLKQAQKKKIYIL